MRPDGLVDQARHARKKEEDEKKGNGSAGSRFNEAVGILFFAHGR
jgi:hypothetical protein